MAELGIRKGEATAYLKKWVTRFPPSVTEGGLVEYHAWLAAEAPQNL